jgi:hypothetical protein
MTGAGLMPRIVFPLMTKPDGTLAQTHPAHINSSFGKAVALFRSTEHFFCRKERKKIDLF